MKYLTNYSNFLNESLENAFKTISLDEAKDILNKSYETFDLNKYVKSPIYKGLKDQVRSLSDNFVVQYNTDRFSPHAKNNFYNVFFSNADSWKKYPKRNRSLVCTTSDTYAKDYGKLYYVIPLKNTKVGICPEKDIFFSFKEFENHKSSFANNLNSFISFLTSLCNKYIKDFKPLITFNDWDRTLNALEMLDKKVLVR